MSPNVDLDGTPDHGNAQFSNGNKHHVRVSPMETDRLDPDFVRDVLVPMFEEIADGTDTLGKRNVNGTPELHGVFSSREAAERFYEALRGMQVDANKSW
ncbi:MAG TPA: hypothetical protein VD978_20310 [Azospirillum sp.]|nr:hypothetical protein [Azospirillum sp.]